MKKKRTYLGGLLVLLFLSGCSTTPGPGERQAISPRPKPPAALAQGANASPVIIATASPLQCVTYARRLTGVDLRGDAWTWWQNARGKYGRSSKPKRGSILVLQRTDHLRYGHLAVVTRVRGPREILVEHANWLNRGQIHKHQIVRDVSVKGDWSAVKVWYTPGKTMGKRTYSVSGFIHTPPRKSVGA